MTRQFFNKFFWKGYIGLFHLCFHRIVSPHECISELFQIFYYSVPLFKDAGVDSDTATHASSGVGAVMLVMTVITIPLMDRAGRRSLHLIGLAGMFIFSILITVSLALRVGGLLDRLGFLQVKFDFKLNNFQLSYICIAFKLRPIMFGTLDYCF